MTTGDCGNGQSGIPSDPDAPLPPSWFYRVAIPVVYVVGIALWWPIWRGISHVLRALGVFGR